MQDDPASAALTMVLAPLVGLYHALRAALVLRTPILCWVFLYLGREGPGWQRASVTSPFP